MVGTMGPATRIGAREVTRRFGAVTANQRVSLAVAPGTIHAVVGENGAGKTTLMRILHGMDRPDDGTVVVDDRPVRFASPADGARRGIGMVHQELKLVPELTLLENLVLGREPTRAGRIDWRAARRTAEGLAEDSGLELEWGLSARTASIVARQRLEILRLLYRQADVLILDEPTSVLAPAQVAELMRVLRGLRDRGRTILFISHKLGEVLELADTITVLRGGSVTGTVSAEDTDVDKLVRLMVGAAVPPVRIAERRDPGEVLLAVRDLSALDERGQRRLRGVSFELRSGEVVGVAGVAGNGQDELVDCLVGLRGAIGGRVELLGADVTGASVAERRRRGLAFIPADRRGEGIAVETSVLDNAIAGAQRRPELARDGWFRPGARRRRAGHIVATYEVHSDGLDAPADSLSGGNQQKLVLGRELAGDPRVVIASQPTRGVDVKGSAYIRERLLSLRARGAAVLLVSEDLDELAALSDRVAVVTDGRVAGELRGPLEDYEELGRLMTARGAS
jgi:general nucleoside transport system ATP-binding protein